MGKILQLLANNALGGQSYQLSCTVIIVSAVIYIGQAVVSSQYRHQLNRLRIMTRAVLVGLIYEKTLSAPSATYKDYSAVTLMSTDVDALSNVSEMFHEAWAQVLEVVVGMILLAQQIGWFCVVPLPMIYARNLRPKQLAWNEATQVRINKIISMVNKIKIIKMLGLAKVVERQISSMRQAEIRASKDMRWVSVLANASANALGLFTPAITIILFAAIGNSKLDAETAYTTLAILVMVTHPANMVMTIVPRAITSLASFQRIHEFVSKPRFQDARLLQTTEGATLGNADRVPQVAIEFKDVEFKSASATPVLDKINLRINRGSVVVCIGPTGAGKSMLGLAITGELAPSKGSVSVISRRIGLCAQSLWLPGQSIHETIRGLASKHDDVWYQEVLAACCIYDDILLPSAIRTVEHGQARLSGGQRQRVALARAVYQRHDILVLDDPFSALDQRTQERVISNLLGPDGMLRRLQMTLFLITNATCAYSLADRILLLKDNSIGFDGDCNSFRSYLGSSTEQTIPADDAAKVEMQATPQPSRVKTSKLATKDDEFDVDRRPGDTSVYRYYLGSVGGLNMLALLACTALYSFFSIFPHYWLKWWTQAGATKSTLYMLGYFFSSTVAWASTSSMLWVNFIKLAPRSGAVLHANLLTTVLGARMSFFFNTDTGALVNRFSQDIALIDRELPSAMAALCTQVFKLMMQCSLLVASQKLLVFALPIYGLAIYMVQKVYLHISRQLRYLELESRSAVYTSFLDAVEGITTIRAFGWQQEYLDLHTRHLDLSQRALYLFLCVQRWLNVILDFAVAVVAVVVIGLAVFCTDETSSANVGIALNMVLVANTTLLRLIESWTSMEVSIGAAARLKELEDWVVSEDACADTEMAVPENWPSAGDLVLKGVSVCYGSRVILDTIDLTIPAGTKVFIRGETGSGKSTLFMALLRLSPIHSSSIHLCGNEISHATPSLLRSRCFICIPQDPVSFPEETLRNNMDPYHHHSSQQIKQVLQLLHLWSFFTSTSNPDFDNDGIFDSEADAILNTPLSSFPPLSPGQSQLLALGTAILRSKHQARAKQFPIILLDEPTANLDDEYAELCADVIEEEFTQKGFTVLMITHMSRDLKQRVRRRGKDMVVRVESGKVSVEGC
ncbi:hypothetical protein E4T48_06687 [Aureobasidium sp. EXF-10727]|nr:hypothetical protein E4T48_06687 [Aureobasidium sp. EXF-10727]